MQYCQVNPNDQIPGPPNPLPRNWQNISNFYLLDPEILASYGFYPCVISDKPTFDETTQKLVENLAFDGTQVTQSWIVEALSPEDVENFATTRLTEIGNRIGSYLDQAVSAKQYDTIVSATSWNLSNITIYKDEAAEATAYRDQVWQDFGDLVAGVQAGNTPLPTVDGWFAILPVLWPAPLPPDNGNLPSNGTI